MSALGQVEPDPIAWILEAFLGRSATPMERFESEYGIQGQSWVEGRDLNLLTVLASKPGTGQFRQFIEACKAEYDSVGVWLVMNRDLGKVLRRYGFKRATRLHNGEKLRGYRWRRAEPQPSGEYEKVYSKRDVEEMFQVWLLARQARQAKAMTPPDGYVWTSVPQSPPGPTHRWRLVGKTSDDHIIFECWDCPARWENKPGPVHPTPEKAVETPAEHKL